MALVLLKGLGLQDGHMSTPKRKKSTKLKSPRARDWPATQEQLESVRDELIDKIGAVQFSIDAKFEKPMAELRAELRTDRAESNAKFEKQMAEIQKLRVEGNAKFEKQRVESNAKFAEHNAKFEQQMAELQKLRAEGNARFAEQNENSPNKTPSLNA
jgi:DNA anti-recombination protein RmuC